jgi:uncharacterized protein (TIGR03435 family)
MSTQVALPECGREAPCDEVICVRTQLHDSQLIGAPAWIDVERFDIDARAESAPAEGPEALIPMLRVLLAERFRLRARPESRELPAYVLVLARQDGRLGRQIRPTQVDCATANLVTEAQAVAFTEDGWPFCGMSNVTSSATMSDTGATISGRIRRSAIEMQDSRAHSRETWIVRSWSEPDLRVGRHRVLVVVAPVGSWDG